MMFSLPALATFSTALPISCGERNWPFFMFTTRPDRPRQRADPSARKECRNLQNVADFRGWPDLGNIVYIGENGHARAFLDSAKDAHTFAETRSAIGGNLRAVGLIVGGFENIGHAQIGSNRGKTIGHVRGVRFALDHARARDNEQRRTFAEVDAGGREIVYRMVQEQFPQFDGGLQAAAMPLYG